MSLTLLRIAGIANAVFSFIAFIITLPGLATGSRSWLKTAGYLIVVNAIMTMAIGLDLWLVTLKMRENFSNIWNEQSDAVQGLMQTAVSIRPSSEQARPVAKSVELRSGRRTDTVLSCLTCLA